MILWLILTAVIIFKLWAMNLFPITCDEAYYWLWHKHLALSYVDHPPLIAYFNRLVSLFGEYNLFNFRLAGLVLTLISAFFIWQIGKTLFDKNVGVIAAIFFLLVPHYLMVWLTFTVDNPLALFWMVSLYFVSKIIKEGKGCYWYLLGLSFGLGMLTKYTMAFFLLPLFLLMTVQPEMRRWWTRKEPYLGFVLSIFFFLPVLIWNTEQGWSSFAFHFSRIGRSDFLTNFLMLIGDQIVHFSPFLFLGLIFYARQLLQRSKFLFLFSVPLLVIFIGLTPFIKVWAHWVTVYQFAGIIGMARLVSQSQKAAQRTIAALLVFDILLIALVLFSSSMLLPRQALYQKNYRLTGEYEKLPANTCIITPYLGASSQLAFYAHRNTFMAQGQLKIEENGFGQRQFDLWGGAPVEKGDNVVYYGKKDAATLKKLKTFFWEVEIKPELEFYAIENYLDDLVPYYGQKFKGGVLL